ncbi:MAG: LPS export ABC transporter periplasmic protein LptC [Bacteroidia bacterium]|nr:LPS export ABC transporter periplasmic protein LptC [Bacteroidia bacterium]NNM16870.1 LPS export ABC transporter periplasmic protein LptC [Bacteroidia bacterium]
MLCIFACTTDLETVELVGNKDTLPMETATDLEIIYSDSARIKAIVFAPEFNRFVGTENYTEMDKGINVKFYDGRGNVISTLTSNYAIHKTEEKIMEAREKVEVINEKGEKLETEYLQWNEQTGRIYSNELVTITTPRNKIIGKGLESNQEFTDYTILQPIGDFAIDKE